MVRVQVNPNTIVPWNTYYAQQRGGSLSSFEGQNFQRGAGIGSIFRGLFKMILPAVKNIGRTVGKQALVTGTDIASDMLHGQDFKTTVKRRGKQAGKILTAKAKKKLQQTGSGVRKRKTKKTPPPKQRKRKLQPKLGVSRDKYNDIFNNGK